MRSNVSYVIFVIYQVSLLRFYYVKSVQIRSFFSSGFSSIRTEYGEILCISPYSVRLQENTDQKKIRIWTLHAVFFHLLVIDSYAGM